MKKTILCILIVVAMLVSCIPAFAAEETLLFDVSTFTTQTLTDDTATTHPYFHTYGAGNTLTVEDLSGETFAKFAFKNEMGFTPVHFEWKPEVSLLGKQYYAMRIINDSMPKAFCLRLALGWIAEKALLLSADGNTVEEAQTVSDEVNYVLVIPADFDGWFMMDLSCGFLDGFTDEANGPGGKTFTRTVDQASKDVFVTGQSTAAVVDFSKTVQTVFYIAEYADGAIAAKASAASNLYIGDIKLMDYEAPETSEPVDTNTAEPTNTAGNDDNNPPTGAPIMIGAAISAVASAAYVINRKKRI